MEKINKKWDAKIENNNSLFDAQYKALKEKHQKERNDAIDECQKMQENCMLRPSPNTLKLKKVEAGLASLGKYSLFNRFEEAHDMQLEAQKSIEQDKLASIQSVRTTMEASIKDLDEIQRMVESAFLLKFQESKDELEKEKAKELEEFDKKYKITTNSIVRRQNAEKKQLLKNPNSTYTMSQALTSKYTSATKSINK